MPITVAVGTELVVAIGADQVEGPEFGIEDWVVLDLFALGADCRGELGFGLSGNCIRDFHIIMF